MNLPLRSQHGALVSSAAAARTVAAHPAWVLALGVTIALALAVHPRTSPWAPAALATAAPGAEVVGPRCPLNAWSPAQHQDGLWMLPPQRQVLPFELVRAGYPETPRRAHNVIVEVTCTAYSSTIDQTDSTPFLTASMKRVQPGFIALSRDLLRRYTPGAPFDFGDHVEVIGIGVFRVEDTMHRRWRRRADLWVKSRTEARRWGRRSLLLGRLDGGGQPELFDRSPLLVELMPGQPVNGPRPDPPARVAVPPAGAPSRPDGRDSEPAADDVPRAIEGDQAWLRLPAATEATSPEQPGPAAQPTGG